MEEKIIDTRTAEEILASAKISQNWGKDAFGNKTENLSSELEEIKSKLDNSEWKPAPQANPFTEALNWQKQRQQSAEIAQVMSYDDSKKLFFSFWKAYLSEGQKFSLDPENVKTVQNILKWAIGDPSCEFDLNKSIWLWGSVGAGKSVFACALRDMLDYLNLSTGQVKFNGKRWDFEDMNALFIRAKFDPSAFKVLNTQYSLILDELKEQHFIIKYFGQEQRIIGDLISARYSAWKKSNVRTFVTTNLPPSFAEQFPVLDDREIDRMVEMFTSLQWHGGSLRKN